MCTVIASSVVWECVFCSVILRICNAWHTIYTLIVPFACTLHRILAASVTMLNSCVHWQLADLGCSVDPNGNEAAQVCTNITIYSTGYTCKVKLANYSI